MNVQHFCIDMKHANDKKYDVHYLGCACEYRQVTLIAYQMQGQREGVR